MILLALERSRETTTGPDEWRNRHIRFSLIKWNSGQRTHTRQIKFMAHASCAYVRVRLNGRVSDSWNVVYAKALCLIEFSHNWYRDDKLDAMRKCSDENNLHASDTNRPDIAMSRWCWLLLAKRSMLPLLSDLCPYLRCDGKWKSH